MRVAIALTLAVLLQACRSAPQARPGSSAFDEAYATMSAGRPLEALPLYEKALAEAPDHEGAWWEYVICLRRVGRLSAATRAGWRALELGEPSAAKWGNLGNVFMQAHAFDAARAAFEEAARLANDPAWAAKNFLNLGYREWGAGLTQAAAADYRRAALADPGNPLVAADMAILLASDPDPGVAARGKALLDRVRADLGADEQTAKYVDAALRDLKEKGALTPPHFADASAQELPRALLTRPPPGSAARFELPARGWRTYQVDRDLSVRLEVPETWSELVTQVDPRAVTIAFQPSTGSPRKMLATMIGHPAHSSPKEVRGFVADQMKGLLSKAVEETAPLLDISSATTRGYAFSVTDRDALKHPTMDDVPYLTQGRVAGRRVDLVFSFFALENQETERREALDVVRGIQESP